MFQKLATKIHFTRRKPNVEGSFKVPSFRRTDVLGKQNDFFCKAPNSLLHVTTVLSIRIFRNFCLTRGVQALPFDCLLVRSHQPSTVQRLLWLHRHLVHMQQWGHCSDYLHGVFHEKWLLHSEKIFCKSQLSNTTRTLNNAKQRVWRDPNSNSKISLSECILCIQGWLYNDINPLYIQRNMTCIDLLICILCPSEKPEWNFRRRSPQRKEHYIGLSGL